MDAQPRSHKALPQDEGKLKTLIKSLSKHGQLLFVVDQAATIGALPVAVAQAQGILVAYLPGLAMRSIADLHPGEAKTDARDAYIISNAARTMPQSLHTVQVPEEHVAELSMLCGFDDDLAKQATATSNRIRGILLRSTRPWNGSSASTLTTRPWPSSSPNTPPMSCAGPGMPSWKPCCASTHPGPDEGGPRKSSLP
ncbi:hypothetical protein GCM10009628_11130 [Paeniglutamicibacter kerguelensis]|uniref:Transposase IS110-like N-terminal domain-containing protein n=1 Tax=Paeniglutamicibacter kerguelensis TaxID=254788 RepID=A0ABS4XCU1_9MICC|nr:hypothetical protein [Paeniglutamicibacter kerguelensis]